LHLQLTGKRAVVTGGSRGIGLAVARALLGEGVAVALVARGGESLRAAAAALSSDTALGSEGARVVAIPADTTDDASVRAMAALAIELLGGVDILVNSAARPASAGPAAALADITDDALRAELESKVLGYLRCARALAPGMVERGWGRIINISGLNARWAGSLVGSVRNVAVSAMTKNMADELGPSGVNVSVVHPGYTVTERTSGMLAGRAAERGISPDEVAAEFARATSIGRLVTAEEVADVVTFLASPRSVAITGDAVAAGGGQRGPIHY
jgi:NAD(P)-dependent dehydrogenase (short-subunit alcohol dehydrogenase family)